jgi:hypothetical protein
MMTSRTDPTACPHVWRPYPTPHPCGCPRAYCRLCLVPQLTVHEPDCPYGGEKADEGADTAPTQETPS